MHGFDDMLRIPREVREFICGDYDSQFEKKDIACVGQFLKIAKYSILNHHEWFVNSVFYFHGEAMRIVSEFQLENNDFTEICNFLNQSEIFKNFETLKRNQDFYLLRKKKSSEK